MNATTNTNANTEQNAKPMEILSVAQLDMRDYFAAKAMQGMILLRSYSGTAAQMSAEAYKMADAMIKARNAN